ncbi:hypothetical protein [Sphingomonas japonica]|uniref:Sugar transporter n=1 Tax=Sphingomonas japonica TaxID=511662 RepID=A0ABX0TX16_9SPHN|nr:hypothetical protein [Sphingomonas japonica]NIJ22839.1 hypothetical protein [Sphingomonas japonica]
MAGYGRQRPAGWFYAVAAALVLWGAMGVFAFYSDISMSDAARAALSDYDRQLLASRPAWFIYLYGIATWSGLLGSIALIARRAWAYPLYIVSLIASVAMFGYIFAVTDLIAVKGAGETLPFPILIIAIAIFQLWLAGRARQRGWIA